jgi:hypothetical protein
MATPRGTRRSRSATQAVRVRHVSRNNLPPREHRVCAWADDCDGIITVPGFRAALENQCAKVTLAEKSHENVELKLITKEMMEVEAAKMP